MYPGTHAKSTPDKPAVIMAGSGEAVSYRQLDERSNRLAQWWWQQGLRPEDHVALFMENHPRFYEVYWAAIRSGLYLTAINRFLTPSEAAYIVNDCGAQSLISSSALPAAEELATLIPNCPRRLMTDGVVPGYDSYERAVASMTSEPLASEPLGRTMLYSSGTTGRPKGIKRPLLGTSACEGDPQSDQIVVGLFGYAADMVYLSPAPLYHAAPLAFSVATHRHGGTVVVMEKFDPEVALELIEKYQVTTSQWVPTMFIRMLKLPPEARHRYDLSSHRVAIHAAAPCPVDVKKQMIEWWGPILHEYYAGSEGNGLCYVSSEQWLERPGTVGRGANATIHICDDDGRELGPGEAGTIYFEQAPDRQLFSYHNDADKTRESRHPAHERWTTLGDVGYVDEEGYLFLTDRKAFMIISGGVNIYPQEIEDALVMHHHVADVAVFGVPDAEMGEAVKAVVQPADWQRAGEALAAELLDFLRSRLAAYKMPQSVEFEKELPRLPTGKLYKRLLRDRYWQRAPNEGGAAEEGGGQ